MKLIILSNRLPVKIEKDENNEFIARGYFGMHNKGDGWVLTSKEDEYIDLENAINILFSVFILPPYYLYAIYLGPSSEGFIWIIKSPSSFLETYISLNSPSNS